MYALLLICAVAIAQDSGKNAFTLADGPHVRHFPIAAGKTPEVRLKVPESENFQRGITALGGKTVLTISAKDAKTLDETEIILRRNNLIDLDTIVRVFKYERAKPSDIAKALNELKAKDASYNLSPQNGKWLLVQGTPEVVNAVEAIISSLEKLQEKTDAEVISLELPAALSTEEELMALVKGLGITSEIEITYNTKDKRVLTGARTNIERIEKALAERGLLPPTSQVEVFSLKHIDAGKVLVQIQKLALKDTRLGLDARVNSIVVYGNKESIEKVRLLVAELDKAPMPANDKKVDSIRIFQLQYASANEIADALKHLEFAKVKIAPEASSNSIAVRGDQKDINIIEALISNLDIKGAGERKEIPAPNAAESKSRTYVYRLVNKPASEVARTINRMEIDGVNLTADERTNSVIIQAAIKELKIVIGIIQSLDMKVFPTNETKLTAPDPVVGTLWTDFAKAEAKSIATAGELRIAAAKFGNEHPTMRELRTRLETEVKIAFDLRHKLQHAEAAELRRQLTEIESRLTKREKNKPAIIKARIDSLLNMDDLGWEAMSKPKAEAEKPVAESTTKRKPTAEEMALTHRAMTWARVDRDEYVSVKTYREYAIANDPSRTRGVESHLGVLVGGNALIAKGEIRNCEVIIGPKTLPSRLAGVAPMRVVAYRSDRYPSKGVTKLIHTAEEGESVWAFMPDEISSLTSAKVFLSPGADLAFEKKEAFGIEAEGKLEPGYIVTNDRGEFLGVVASNRGSLGSVLSAPAIRDWIERSNLAPPTIEDPLTALAIVSAGSEQSYCPIVKGVILTQPAVVDAKPEFLAIKRFGQLGNLTIANTSKSSNGKWGLIWTKELSPTDGFTTSEAVMHDKDTVVFVDPRRLAELQESNYSGRFNDRFGQYPTTAKILSEKVFRVLSPEFVEVRTDGGKESNTFDPGNLTAIVTTVSGHWLGAGNAVADKVSRAKVPRRWSYQFEFESADEILRIVEEESKKIATDSEVTNSTVSANPPDSKPTLDSSTPTQAQKDAFWKRIKEPEALIRVSVNHELSRNVAAPREFEVKHGAIVSGCIFLPHFLVGKELAEVGEKSLPDRQAGITPSGLYIYHRNRLPTKGFTQAGELPKEGDRIWAVIGGNHETLTSGIVLNAEESRNELLPHKEREFSLESDGRLEPGAVIFSDEGHFLGMVTRNKGSLAVAEHATSIMGFLKRITLDPPKPAKPSEAMVWLPENGNGSPFRCLNLRGVMVADPALLNQDLSTLRAYTASQKGIKLTKKHAVKILNDRLALIWCDEIKPEDGMHQFRNNFEVDDYAFSLEVMPPGMGGEPPSNRTKPTSGFFEKTFASRITTSFENEFDLDWYKNTAKVGDPVFDPGWHLLGFSVPASAEVRAKQGMQNATTVIKASEILRLIEEESKKLPPAATPEINTEKPAEKPPETPKTETTPEPPK